MVCVSRLPRPVPLTPAQGHAYHPRGLALFAAGAAALRTLVREMKQNLGVYLVVETPGGVSAGDAVELLD